MQAAAGRALPQAASHATLTSTVREAAVQDVLPRIHLAKLLEFSPSTFASPTFFSCLASSAVDRVCSSNSSPPVAQVMPRLRRGGVRGT